jgi:hypothetical protein
MKNLMIIVFAFGIFACGTGKEITDSTEVEDKVVMIEGVVKDKTNADGCGFVIEVSIDSKRIVLEPLALEDKYKVDGKAVKIAFSPSKRLSKCGSSMPITIDKITE